MPGRMAACRRLRERPRQDLRARPPGNAGKAVDVVAERAGAPPPSSPVRLSGSIPPLAESFHQRPETGLHLRAGLYPGDTVVLTHGKDTPIAPAAQGGTGKTQLAVAFTHARDLDRAAAELEQVLAGGADPQRWTVLFPAWQLALLLHDGLRQRVGLPQLEQPEAVLQAIAQF